MAYDAGVLRRATQQLERDRRERQEKAERLRRDVYARSPGWSSWTGSCSRPWPSWWPPPCGRETTPPGPSGR